MSSGSGRQASFQDDSPPSATGGQPNRGAALVDCASGRLEDLENAAPFTDELKVAGPAQRARSSAFLDCWNGGHDLIWRRRHLRQSALKRPVAPTVSPSFTTQSRSTFPRQPRDVDGDPSPHTARTQSAKSLSWPHC